MVISKVGSSLLDLSVYRRAVYGNQLVLSVRCKRLARFQRCGLEMDAEELERLHRDEKRLAQYACEQAKRQSELSHLFATSWVREIERMDWQEIEVIE